MEIQRNVKPPAMSPQRRELFMQCVDGFPQNLPIVYFIDGLVRCEPVLKWLSGQNIVGKELHDWQRAKFGRSFAKMSAYILKEIDRNLEAGPLLFGRDVKMT